MARRATNLETTDMAGGAMVAEPTAGSAGGNQEGGADQANATAPPAPGVGNPSNVSPLSGLPPAAAQHIEKLTVMVMEMYQALQQFIPVVVQKIDALEQVVMGGGAGQAEPQNVAPDQTAPPGMV